MIRAEALNQANSILKDYNLSLKILSIVLRKEVSFTFSHLNEDLKKKEEKKFFEIIKKLKEGNPLGYILRKEKFYGLELELKEGVFIPRPETEFLVEYVLKLNLQKNAKILDIGTGSGAIAIALKKNKRNFKVFASDISLKALLQAKKNSLKYKTKINFFCADLLESIKGKFDLIVSNPPYIPDDFMKNLPENVKKEPEIALKGGKDGVEIICEIIRMTRDKMRKNGFLIMEIGEGQLKRLRRFGIKEGFRFLDIVKDYNNIERVISFQWLN